MKCSICGSEWHKDEQCPKRNVNQTSNDEPKKVRVSFEVARMVGFKYFDWDSGFPIVVGD